MTPATLDNALAALDRARQAQERHDRRIDVQLRLETVRAGASVAEAPALHETTTTEQEES